MKAGSPSSGKNRSCSVPAVNGFMLMIRQAHCRFAGGPSPGASRFSHRHVFHHDSLSSVFLQDTYGVLRSLWEAYDCWYHPGRVLSEINFPGYASPKKRCTHKEGEEVGARLGTLGILASAKRTYPTFEIEVHREVFKYPVDMSVRWILLSFMSFAS